MPGPDSHRCFLVAKFTYTITILCYVFMRLTADLKAELEYCALQGKEKLYSTKVQWIKWK